jgi:pyridoxine kinase
MATVLSISSHVARGAIGSRASVFALERMGHEVWSVPTVILPYHPGHGPGTRIEMPAGPFAALLDDLAGRPDFARLDAVFTGYLAHADQVEPVAALIDRLKRHNPDARHLCDPVLGDDGRLYVAEPLARAVRDRLVPRADILTPNAFELAWLAGREALDNAALAAAARAISDATVLVTSAHAMRRGCIATLAVEGARAVLAEAVAVENPPHGTGDLLASLFLGHTLRGTPLEPALTRSLASLHDILVQTARTRRDEMALVAEQGRLERSAVPVHVSRLAVKTAQGLRSDLEGT